MDTRVFSAALRLDAEEFPLATIYPDWLVVDSLRIRVFSSEIGWITWMQLVTRQILYSAITFPDRCKKVIVLSRTWMIR